MLTCGIEYEGTVIEPASGGMVKRTSEPTLQACQTLCHNTLGCVALNYEGTNCTLLSSVTGISYVPGAVGGSIVPSSRGGGSSGGVSGQHTVTTFVAASGRKYIFG